MADDDKARAVGLNHVALEVGDIDEALAFYGKIFELRLRGRGETMAFIDMGDQFIAIAQTGGAHRDEHRHFGLVVDDKDKALAAARAAGADFLPGRDNDFRDPWGNRFQVVQYSDIQFTKAGPVLKAMGLGALEKSAEAIDQLRKKGIEPG